MQRELTTWIIVTHNDVDFTIKAARSIREFSDNKHDEIIVLDDGSEAHFAELLKPHLLKLRCEYIYCDRKDRPMLSHLRGLGREKASNDWVIWLDNDARLDISISPQHLVKILQNQWRKNPGLGAIQPSRYTPRGKQGANKFDRNLTYVGSDTGNEFARAMYPDGCFWMSHRSTFDLWNFRSDLSCFEDSCIGLQMYNSGLSIYSDNTIGVYHHVWASGLWQYAMENPQYRDIVISEYKEDIDRICSEFGT